MMILAIQQNTTPNIRSADPKKGPDQNVAKIGKATLCVASLVARLPRSLQGRVSQFLAGVALAVAAVFRSIFFGSAAIDPAAGSEKTVQEEEAVVEVPPAAASPARGESAPIPTRSAGDRLPFYNYGFHPAPPRSPARFYAPQTPVTFSYYGDSPGNNYRPASPTPESAILSQISSRALAEEDYSWAPNEHQNVMRSFFAKAVVGAENKQQLLKEIKELAIKPEKTEREENTLRQIWDTIHDGDAHCGDRATTLYNRLELTMRTQNASTTEELRDTLMAQTKNNLLEIAVRRDRPSAEDVESVLYAEKHLAQGLGVSQSSTNMPMLYEATGQSSQEYLKQWQDEVSSQTDSKEKQFNILYDHPVWHERLKEIHKEDFQKHLDDSYAKLEQLEECRDTLSNNEYLQRMDALKKFQNSFVEERTKKLLGIPYSAPQIKDLPERTTPSAATAESSASAESTTKEISAAATAEPSPSTELPVEEIPAAATAEKTPLEELPAQPNTTQDNPLERARQAAIQREEQKNLAAVQ